MSQWLKWRLIALFCAVTLCGGASYLRAQNDYPAPAKTPEEAGEQFFVLLAAGEKHDDYSHPFKWEHIFPFAGAISREQMISISNRTQNGGPERLFALLAKQMRQPSFAARVTQTEGEKTIVEVSPVLSPKPREVVCIREDGGWRVDLFATYAKWNNLSGAALDEEIYRFTGIVSPALRSSDTFLRNQCQSNLKQVMLGVLQYTLDYDEKMPPARRWSEVLDPYTRNLPLFTCPALPAGKKNGYAFNQNLSQLGTVHYMFGSATLVSIYETSNLEVNVFGPGTGRAYRHMDGANFAFADGHIKWYPRSNSAQLCFKP